MNIVNMNTSSPFFPYSLLCLLHIPLLLKAEEGDNDAWGPRKEQAESGDGTFGRERAAERKEAASGRIVEDNHQAGGRTHRRPHPLRRGSRRQSTGRDGAKSRSSLNF